MYNNVHHHLVAPLRVVVVVVDWSLFWTCKLHYITARFLRAQDLWR